MLPNVPAPYPTIFGVLLAIWMGAYVVGFLTGTPSEEGRKRLPLWTKIVMIGVAVAMPSRWQA